MLFSGPWPDRKKLLVRGVNTADVVAARFGSCWDEESAMLTDDSANGSALPWPLVRLDDDGECGG